MAAAMQPLPVQRSRTRAASRPGGVADELEDVLHQRLGIGARDQDAGGDLEFEVEEVGAAGQIGDGLVLGGAADEFAVAGELAVLERALVVGVDLDARDGQDVRQEQLGRQTRGIDVLAGEEGGGPFQQPPDRPCSAVLSHVCLDCKW